MSKVLPRSLQNVQNKLLLAVMGCGVLLAMSAFLYYFLPPSLQAQQCPMGYTQQQVDEGNCIIGADLTGAGLFIGGTYVFVVGSVALVTSLVLQKYVTKNKKPGFNLKRVVEIAVPFGIVLLPLLARLGY